jgi:NAD(P)-dependent dehydrogenase (short-subunit alcohol dehydrogenase family)
LCPAVVEADGQVIHRPHSSATSRISNRRSAPRRPRQCDHAGHRRDRADGTFQATADIYNLYAAHTVFNRWSSADEVATAVAHLASDAASHVSGSTLFVDGGWTAIDGPPTGLTQLTR